jgi:hypothetical protein
MDFANKPSLRRRMTYHDTYAGRLRNPAFDWSDESQELASNDIEFLTESFLDSDSFSAVYDRVREKAVPYRTIDWGSWVVPATKSEILSLMARWKIGHDLPEPGDEIHKPRLRRAQCLAMVNSLPSNGAYVLVIEEF